MLNSLNDVFAAHHAQLKTLQKKLLRDKSTLEARLDSVCSALGRVDAAISTAEAVTPGTKTYTRPAKGWTKGNPTNGQITPVVMQLLEERGGGPVKLRDIYQRLVDRGLSFGGPAPRGTLYARLKADLNMPFVLIPHEGFVLRDKADIFGILGKGLAQLDNVDG